MTGKDASCAGCTSFRNDADHLEQAFPGLTALSSGRGSVRSTDGICARHDLYLPSIARCNDYRARATATGSDTAHAGS